MFYLLSVFQPQNLTVTVCARTKRINMRLAMFHDYPSGPNATAVQKMFGTESRNKTSAQQTADWEKIKAAERAAKARKCVLDEVALGLPALMRAVKLQKRAARVGFDWPQTDQVLDKLIEESHELVEARDQLGADEIEEEFGDLLFVMANLARHLDVDPETALRGANAKLTRRFAYIEEVLAQRGKRPDQSDLAEMDRLWNEAKAIDKTQRAATKPSSSETS